MAFSWKKAIIKAQLKFKQRKLKLSKSGNSEAVKRIDRKIK